MPRYELALLAQRDLRGIDVYTLRTWGLEQTLRYGQSLEENFVRLAASPHLGRLCPNVHPTARHYEHEKHVIFYREMPWGIRVLRVLHERQLPRLHAI